MRILYTQPITSFYNNHSQVLSTLANLLQNDSLCLFLGSGVSESTMKFPSWPSLVEACMALKSVTGTIGPNPSTDTLLRNMEKVKSKCANDDEYNKLVSSVLYKNFDLDFSHAKNMLLISIGALVMSSRRGSISEIVTYNFDDLIEWYLDIHGYKSQVISKLPYLNESSDIKTFHPHGFLPISDKYQSLTTSIIFDSQSYELTIGRENSPWYKLCFQLLASKVALMVGLSGTDPIIKTIISRVNEHLKDVKGERPICFLFNKKDSFDLTDEECQSRGIVPVLFDSYDDIWSFLLNICQRAAA